MDVPSATMQSINLQNSVDHTIIGKMVCDYEHPHSCFFHKERPKYFLITSVLHSLDERENKIINGKINKEQKEKITSSTTRIKSHKRTPISIEQKKLLNDWLMSHKKYPYPTSEEKEILAQLTGLTKEQIRVWFTNSRMRNTCLDNFTRKNARPQQ